MFLRQSAGGARKSVAIESADSPESTATQPSKMTDTRPSVDSKTSATFVTAQPVTRKEMELVFNDSDIENFSIVINANIGIVIQISICNIDKGIFQHMTLFKLCIV